MVISGICQLFLIIIKARRRPALSFAGGHSCDVSFLRRSNHSPRPGRMGGESGGDS